MYANVRGMRESLLLKRLEKIPTETICIGQQMKKQGAVCMFV